MRIIHFTEVFWPRIGGIETFLNNLVSWQRESGDTVLVLSEQAIDSLSPHEWHDGIEIHRKPFGPAILSNDVAALGGMVRETAALLRSFRPDIIHVHISNGPFTWLHALTQHSFPVASVVTLHMPRASVLVPEAILARTLGTTGCITAASEATRNEWCMEGSDFAEKSSVVAYGVPWPAVRPRPLCFEPVTLLCVGRLDPLKGFDVALRAFAEVGARWPGMRLVIAGEGPDRRRLEQVSAELGLESRVDFRGWVAPYRVSSTMNEATIVLMPSHWQEPFGLVAVETAQMGRPIIASCVGGLPEVVVHDETGLLVPPEDPGALAAAIELLARDPERARRLGAAARKRARVSFAMERCAQDYRQIYHSLAGVGAKSANADAHRILD